MNEVYLQNMDMEEAVEIFLGSCNVEMEVERIKTEEAQGRITARPVYSINSSPHFNAAAMDGIAVRSYETFGATRLNHKRLKKGINYMVVDTGDPLPEGFDAVIMVENLIRISDDEVEIIEPAVPWQHVRPIGEDMAANELIIPTNHRITPVDIGAMLAGGVLEVEVYRVPRVGIIPTGTEIVKPGSELKPGDIVEFNSSIISGYVREWGGEPAVYEIVPDDRELLKRALERACDECDIVMTIAGSSAGREDYTSSIIEEMGRMLVHGVATKPAKPVILGLIQNKPFIGVPGYPVSCYFTLDNYLKPLLYKVNRQILPARPQIDAIVSHKLVSSLKEKEFVRIKLGKVGDKLIATSLNRGAGVIMSLVRADGILIIPRESEGYEAGEQVRVELLKDIREIEGTLVVIGSHDLLIDVLSDFLHARFPFYSLSSANVGSMGGIMALTRGECHLAPMHLLDFDTGEYNVSYIKKYLKDKRISLIKFVKRVQGFIVPKGNPKDIRNFTDLVRDDVTFVNRQRGAGTRLLLDYNLQKLGINPASIKGYEHEEYTHLQVAAQVASGAVDTGLGVKSAAQAFNLDFIPVGEEEYDLAIPTEFLEMDNVKKLLDIMRSDEFKREVDRLGGYDTSNIGTILHIT